MNEKKRAYTAFARRLLLKRLGWSVKYGDIVIIEGHDHQEDDKLVIDQVTFEVIKNGVLLQIVWDNRDIDLLVNGRLVGEFICEA